MVRRVAVCWLLWAASAACGEDAAKTETMAESTGPAGASAGEAGARAGEAGASVGEAGASAGEAGPRAGSAAPDAEGAAGQVAPSGTTGGAGSATGGAGAADASAGAGGAADAGSAGAGAAGMAAPAGPTGEPTFTAIFKEIFTVGSVGNCMFAGCHGAPPDPMLNGNLTIMFDDQMGAYENLVGVTSTSTLCSGRELVIPGDAAGSLLIQKFSDSPPCGMKMPIGRPLTEAQIKQIATWINDGAKNN